MNPLECYHRECTVGNTTMSLQEKTKMRKELDDLEYCRLGDLKKKKIQNLNYVIVNFKQNTNELDVIVHSARNVWNILSTCYM